MSGPDGEQITKETQRKLHETCYHPTGRWQAVEWQTPVCSIPDCIASIARDMPERPAVFDAQGSLTYSELDQAANRIAHAVMASQGVGQGVVALLVGMDALAVAAALGVLKAGKIYVALEASFPEKRSEEILDDAQAKLILADEKHVPLAKKLAGNRRVVLQLEGLGDREAQPPEAPVPLDRPAILNYTSGSTGLPKGVLQSHRSAYMQAVRYASYYHVCAEDRLAHFGSLAWAGTFWDTFGPLCLGASTGPFDLRQHGMQRLVEWLLQTEPTLLAGLMVVRQVAYACPEERFRSVRLVHLGGDTIFRQDVEACMRVFPKALMAVGLGCSEAGRVTELFLDSPEMLAWDVMPLGLPMPGLDVKLVSEDGQQVARGQVGEIVVRGAGLAEGYWRRPELTASRFQKLDPMDPAPAYFTGDLGRWMPDGFLQHVGRVDHMVKIRGYQVFTGEIETLLREVEGVVEACVVAHPLPQGVQRLAAYLVVDHQRFPGAPALYAQFEDVPAHMVPQSLVLVDAMPTTLNGKVDRQRLPVPQRSRLGVTAEYAGARNRIEEILAKIWSTVLGIEAVGINDDFLELGGDSLDSTRIINQVAGAFSIEIPFSAFFHALTIAEMAAIIRSALPGSGGRAGP